ncbi:MAG: TaqI-like C-terminal specificity domain-containing protein [Lactobacillus equicursoris]|uniref:TaqI-like C-terminal specificity domain-containing protein n=1 Tax=Lactobacillus equicursoris TaxID=420645 RepID=UPI00242B700D|nr:TaqI-like C-terminal specificity domain-containing protein [Lactobacillus equicursoris]MDD6408121.1 TaqI-like C-terminal specificity domain-containing protein [Lactobacillus equicursoris]
MKDSFGKDESWLILSKIEQSIKKKVEDKGIPLKNWNIQIYRGILTGYNKAFIINENQKNKLIEEDPKSAEIIRPILRGRDIKRYEYTFSGLWLINVHNGIKAQNLPPINIEDYPAIKDYLDNYYPQLAKRADKGDTPYNLRNCVYMNDFLQPKIVWGNLCLSAQFTIAEGDYYINAPSTFIAPGNKYILAVLNSKLGDWYIRQLGVTRNGGYFEYTPMVVQQLPVPQIPEEKQKPFKSMVDIVLKNKREQLNTLELEQRIDQMIYNLYSLSNEERIFLEKESKINLE